MKIKDINKLTKWTVYFGDECKRLRLNGILFLEFHREKGGCVTNGYCTAEFEAAAASQVLVKLAKSTGKNFACQLLENIVTEIAALPDNAIDRACKRNKWKLK